MVAGGRELACTVYASGVVSSVSGTSAAAPVFAGMIALVNAARIDAQKPTLGFLVRTCARSQKRLHRMHGLVDENGGEL